MSYAVVFIYKPTNQVATVWMTFETRAEAQHFAEQRMGADYTYAVRALCERADWPAVQAVGVALLKASGNVSVSRRERKP
jgi:hypothetical protein